MTIRVLNKLVRGVLLLAAGAMLLPAQEEAPAAAASAATASSPRRAKTYREAVEKAGSDGIIVYYYGPDWNARSVRMLKSFWERPEVEAATGNAMLLAVPVYQDPEMKYKTQANVGMPYTYMSSPCFCPAVKMIDANGAIYAYLVGSDGLGDETGDLAIQNMRDKLDVLHKRDTLMKQAQTANGTERTRLLSQAADLPIDTSRELMGMLLESDPSDTTGLVRRHTYKALDFLYEQLETKTGFVSHNFIPNYKKIREECLKIINDETLHARDRQMAYALLIGMSRREKITGKPLKDMIAACAKIDPTTDYGRLSPTLADNWGNLKFNKTADDRRKAREDKKDQRKELRDRKKREKSINVH